MKCVPLLPSESFSFEKCGKMSVASYVVYLHSAPLIYNRSTVEIIDCSQDEKELRDTISASGKKICFQSIAATIDKTFDAFLSGAAVIHYTGTFQNIPV